MAKLEGGSKSNDVDEAMREWHERGLGTRLYDAFTVAGLCIDAIEPGRALFSFTVPPRLTVRAEQLYQPMLFSFPSAARQKKKLPPIYIIFPKESGFL
jgi:acyl-coenzyme A thioesterase 13